MTLATRIAVMDAGRFLQIGTPAEIYEYPNSRYVADFFGTVNMFEVKVSRLDDKAVTFNCIPLDADIIAELNRNEDTNLDHRLLSLGEKLWVAVRPEKINISQSKPTIDNWIKGQISDLGYFGNHSIYRVKTQTGEIIQVSAQNHVRANKKIHDWADDVYVSWDASACIILDQ